MQTSNLDDVCAVVGYRATRILAAWFAGRNLFVPERTTETHPLGRLVGDSAFRALVASFGGQWVWVPSPSEDRRYFVERVMAEQMSEGMCDAEIAEFHLLSLKRVQQLRVELDESGWIDYAAGIQPSSIGRGNGGRDAGLNERYDRVVRKFSDPGENPKPLPPPENGAGVVVGCYSGPDR
jgi:hypothetical protein